MWSDKHTHQQNWWEWHQKGRASSKKGRPLQFRDWTEAAATDLVTSDLLSPEAGGQVIKSVPLLLYSAFPLTKSPLPNKPGASQLVCYRNFLPDVKGKLGNA